VTLEMNDNGLSLLQLKDARNGSLPSPRGGKPQ
jgi:hypothetical protein